MATKTSSQDLANLVINRVESPTAFQQMVAAGQVNANELYLVEGDETVTYSISKSGGTITLTGSDGSTSTVTVPTATSDLTNDSGFITSASVPNASSSTPAMDGTGAAGSSSAYARGDHVHPTDTSRAPTSHASTATTYGAGTSSNYGHLKLSASTTSTLGTSGGTAATPSAVKAVKDAIPTATSELTNDSGYITDAGVTSFNGSTGAITYTAPVTSVNGDTGAVTVTVPTATSDLTNDSGFITEDDLIFPEIIGNADSGTTVTATSGSKAITGTATGGTFDLKIPSYGTWSVSGTVDGGTASATVEVDAVKEYDVVLYPELEDASWAMISTAAQEGIAGSIWSVGDTKSVAISGTIGTLEIDTTLNVYIIGINHRGENGITFQGFKTAQTGGTDVCLIDSHYNTYSTSGLKWFSMNHWGDNASPYNTNYGGWAACDMRYDILGSTNVAPTPYGSTKTTGATGSNPTSTCATSPVSNTLMSCLPSDLRVVMRPMTVYTDNKGNSSDVAANVTTTTDYLPLLAEFEIFGARTYANQYEQNYQSQYDYYAAGNSKVKYIHSETGSTAFWWERSPYCNNDSHFCDVDTSGAAYYRNSRLSCGLAPAFKI